MNQEQYKQCTRLLALKYKAQLLTVEEDGVERYDLDGYSIEICPEENEIVFVGDQGDFVHIPICYFALLGALVHYNFGVKPLNIS